MYRGVPTINYITQDISVYGKILNTEYKDYKELVLKFGKPEIGKPTVETQEPLKLELEHFIECVREDKRPLVDGVEGLKNVEIALNASKFIDN